MSGSGWRFVGALSLVAMVAAGCGGNDATTPTTPTPTPTPAPAPTPTPTPTPTPPSAPAELSDISLNPASVEGQGTPVGTVTLTAAAPAGGAVVALESGNPEVAKVPSSVTVAAGATTATFAVDTSTVPVQRDLSIIARYLGVTKLAVLTVRPPALIPRFNVTSPSRGNSACSIANASGAIDCQFETSQSSGFIASYLWTLKVGNTETNFTTSNATYSPLTVCANVSGGTVSQAGTVAMTVTLVLEDRSGNRSSPSSVGVALTPSGFCGY